MTTHRIYSFLKFPKSAYYPAFTLGFSLLTILFLFSLIRVQLRKTKTEIQQKLQIITQTAALALDTDKLRELSEEWKADPSLQTTSLSHFNYLNTFLNQLKEHNDLELPVYLLIPKLKNGHTLHLPVVPQQRTALSDQPSQNILLAFSQKGQELDSTRQSKTDLLSKTIFAQSEVRDPDGALLAYLRADIQMTPSRLYLTTFKSMPWVELGFFFSFLCLGFVTMQRSFIKRHRHELKLRDTLIARNEEVKSQNEQISAQDEWIKETLKKLEQAKHTIEQRNKELNILNKVLDIKVQRRTQELEKTSLELSTFLYRSSHDIMGPIATLKGLCNLAMSEVHEQKGQNYIKLVNTTVEQLSHTIRNISVVFEIRNKALCFQNIRLKEFIDTIYEKQAKQFHSKDIELITDIDDQFYFITDSYLFETILSELIKNAFKSLQSRKSHYGGQQDEAYIKTSLFRYQDRIELKIDDSGTGLNKAVENELNHLFNQKAHAKNKGYGMGLYVAKSAIERLKGHISILHKDEPGSAFLISLPVREKN